jgi:hypothetical protein
MSKRIDWSDINLTSEPVADLAARLGVSTQRIYQILKARGEKPFKAVGRKRKPRSVEATSASPSSIEPSQDRRPLPLSFETETDLPQGITEEEAEVIADMFS